MSHSSRTHRQQLPPGLSCNKGCRPFVGIPVAGSTNYKFLCTLRRRDFVVLFIPKGLTARDAKVRFRTKVQTRTFQNQTKVRTKVQQIAELDQKSGPVFGQQGKILNLFELGPNWTYGPGQCWSLRGFWKWHDWLIWRTISIWTFWLVDMENNKNLYGIW